MVYQERYASTTDFLARLAEPIPSKYKGRSATSINHSSEGGRWDFGVGYDGAVNLAKYGWPEGREAVNKFSGRLTAAVSGMIKLPEIRYDVVGDYLDWDRLNQGDPECFYSIVDSAFEIEASPAKIVRIVVNVFASYSISAESLKLKGAACVALCDILERHNIRCQIDMVCSVQGGEFYVGIKQPEWPINIDAVAYYFAHPSCFRRLFFALFERVEDSKVSHEIGAFSFYGYKKIAEDQGDLYIDGLESRIGLSEEKAIAWIIEQLEKQGIEVEHE